MFPAIPAIPAVSALKPALKIGLAVLFVALLAFAVWWAAILPRTQLSAVRGDFSAYQAKMIAATATAAEKTRAAQTAINASLKEYSRESEFAAERTKIALENAQRDAAGRIADLRRAGDARVQDVWRQCLARPADGNGTAVAEGSADLSDDGAKALGPVLAVGRSADLLYGRAIEELTLTRGLLATCYQDQSTK